MSTPARFPFAGAVLCGGSSTRMGRDKAMLELEGRPLARRVADALAAAGAAPVVAIGGDRAALGRVGLTALPDDHPGEGPLGGILTALRVHGDHAIVAVLACDLVEPDPATIARIVDALGAGADTGQGTGTGQGKGTVRTPDVAVPVDGGRRHLHHAAWHRGSMPALEAAFTGGERAPRRAAEALEVIEVAVERAAVLDDVDDPEAYAAAERRWNRRPPHPG